MKESDVELYKGKTLGSILEEIHNESASKRKFIMDIIKEYSAMVQGIHDVVTIGPIINSLLDSSLKNDDQVVKIATIAQRIIAASYRGSTGGEGDFALSEQEREQLLKMAHRELEEAVDEAFNTALDLEEQLKGNPVIAQKVKDKKKKDEAA